MKKRILVIAMALQLFSSYIHASEVGKLISGLKELQQKLNELQELLKKKTAKEEKEEKIIAGGLGENIDTSKWQFIQNYNLSVAKYFKDKKLKDLTLVLGAGDMERDADRFSGKDYETFLVTYLCAPDLKVQKFIEIYIAAGDKTNPTQYNEAQQKLIEEKLSKKEPIVFVADVRSPWFTELINTFDNQFKKITMDWSTGFIFPIEVLRVFYKAIEKGGIFVPEASWSGPHKAPVYAYNAENVKKIIYDDLEQKLRKKDQMVTFYIRIVGIGQEDVIDDIQSNIARSVRHHNVKVLEDAGFYVGLPQDDEYYPLVPNPSSHRLKRDYIIAKKPINPIHDEGKE